MGEIITSLAPAQVIASTSVWLGALFNEMWPVALIGLGIGLAGIFVAWLIAKIGATVKHVFSSSKFDSDEYWTTWQQEERRRGKFFDSDPGSPGSNHDWQSY